MTAGGPAALSVFLQERAIFIWFPSMYKEIYLYPPFGDYEKTGGTVFIGALLEQWFASGDLYF